MSAADALVAGAEAGFCGASGRPAEQQAAEARRPDAVERHLDEHHLPNVAFCARKVGARKK